MTDTEKLIISKSKELFYQKGKIKATSQEIADFSGVQRTLVNYYFRSKDNLFKIVHSEIIQEFHERMNAIFTANCISFEEKIDLLIEFTFLFKERYPYFEVYSIIESNKLFDKETFMKPQSTNEMRDFLLEVQKQMDAGVIRKSHPINFVMDIFSLISYPLVLKEVYKDVFDLTEEGFEQIIQERKTIIKNLIFNK